MRVKRPHGRPQKLQRSAPSQALSLSIDSSWSSGVVPETPIAAGAMRNTTAAPIGEP